MSDIPMKTSWRELLARWVALSARDRNIAIGVAIAICVGIYALLIWPMAGKQIARIEYDLQKQAVRDKASSKATAAAPQAQLMAGLGGKNVSEAKRELDSLKRQLEDKRAELTRLNAGFVPMDDLLAMNVLKAGLTSLAEAGDMEVLALEHVQGRTDDKDRAPTVQAIREAALANPFKRPLVTMRARASYHGLMQFLDGLSALPYVAAPVASDIEVEVERDPKTQAPIRQWLRIQIKFAL